LRDKQACRQLQQAEDRAVRLEADDAEEMVSREHGGGVSLSVTA
jgi:hypothetical protein